MLTSAAPATETTPAEDAAARAQEAQEQAALPYKWTQTIADLSVTFTVPGNLKSRDLVIAIKKQTLSAGVKGQDPVIAVRKHPPLPSTPGRHSSLESSVSLSLPLA